uniref:Metaxin glutathione S-transferase domain-containing protein n=1 Tax=Eptatretus burgeri TaxID=7764 RepID=A0A8C4QV59_EPTBU
MHTFWGDAFNYSEFTRPWLASSLPFPMGLILPGRVRGSATERFTQMVTKSSDATDEEFEQQMYSDATECLSLLSQSLGSREYFFSDRPSSLDAVVFAHVAPLIKARLPNSRLQHHVKSLDNLCLLCHRVLHQYFPHVEDGNFFIFLGGGEGGTFLSNLMMLPSTLYVVSMFAAKVEKLLNSKPYSVV